MIKILKNILKQILPISFKRKIKTIYFKIQIKQVRGGQHKALLQLRHKKKIKVAFFLIYDSVWKYDGVYQLMQKDERFDPIVVVCPYIIYGEDTMLHEMDHAYNTFLKKGYNVIKTYNKDTKIWLDVKKEIKPDIIFFTNPHRLTKDEYYITNYPDCLTCYVPYAFVVIHLLDSHYNQVFQNLLWKAFYETTIHEGFAKKCSVNRGINVVVTGYPGIDRLNDAKYQPSDPWKIKNRNVKRIIWAPHHTIEGEGAQLDYSNFIQYAETFLMIAEKYKNKIQIAFKPHPLLKPKLYNVNIWGTDKTEKYFKKWETLSNGLLNESEYVDLFLTSDAMIHDSASFMVEYLYTGKPVAFTVRDAKITERFNDFGKIVYKCLYKVNSEDEIDDFIQKVVFEGNDYMMEERTSFVKNTLLPPNGKTASENIFNEINREIFGDS